VQIVSKTRLDENGELWQGVLADVRDSVSEPAFETALKNASVRVEEGGRVILRFPEPFMLRMINPEGSRCLEAAFSKRMAGFVQLELLADPRLALEEENVANASFILDRIRNTRETLVGEELPRNIRPLSPMGDLVRLNPRYTFESLVVGSHNRLAHAAAQAVAKEPGRIYNPFFIYASTGLGKTHLLQAIGHETLVTRPEARVCYVTTEEFTNQLIEGIQHRERMIAFNRKYRNVDLLLIDDIQFLIGKVQTQEAFFHTFNTLHELGRQVVITSDRPPAEFDTLEERLKSRFEWGLISDISKPDYETRLAILHRKNQEQANGIPSEILARIAARIDGSVRELEGGLTKVSAHQRLSRVPLAVEEVDEILAHMRAAKKGSRVPSPQEIMEETANHFRITVDELMGERRTARITVPRQVGMYFCREMTHLSLKDIGGAFGGKDHTTVIYALTRVEERVEVDEAFAREIMLLKARLKERFRDPAE
jgi:chromosomal replication initiator protein